MGFKVSFPGLLHKLSSNEQGCMESESSKGCEESYSGKKESDDTSVLRAAAIALASFKSTAQHVKAVEALKELAAVQERLGFPHLSIRSLVEAANILYRDLNLCESAAGLHVSCSKMYYSRHSYEEAVFSLKKAAEMVKESSPKHAARYYKDLVKICELHLKSLGIPLIESAVKYTLEEKLYREAIELYNSKIRILAYYSNLFQVLLCVVSVVVIYLFIHDVEGAVDSLKDMRQIVGVDDTKIKISSNSEAILHDFEISNSLIAAYLTEDYTLWQNTTIKLLRKPLEKEIVELAIVAPFIAFDRRPFKADERNPQRDQLLSVYSSRAFK